MKRISLVLFSTVAALLVFVPNALADVPQPSLTLSPDQTWLAIIGALVPLVTYAINHWAPWVSEEVKGLIQVVVAGVAGALWKIIEAGGDIAFNAVTAQYVLTAVVAALAAHHFLWKPSGISTRLGAGSNANPK